MTRLVSTDGDSAKDLVINVEYNQLDPLLRAASADGQTGLKVGAFSHVCHFAISKGEGLFQIGGASRER